MTLQEALKAMQTHRVRHRYFDKEDWVTKCTNGLYYFKDGTNFTEEEFLLWVDKSYFKEGWEIIPNTRKGVQDESTKIYQTGIGINTLTTPIPIIATSSSILNFVLLHI